MKKPALLLFFSFYILILASCHDKKAPAAALIDDIHLKRGDVVLCGVPDKQFGSVEFTISSSEKVKGDFNLAISMLHSFEYDEAEKVFAKIIDEDPECAMAYWGVAMSNFHALWAPPTQVELEKGAKAISIAQSVATKSKRETAYIDAIASFYSDWNKTDHRTRCQRFEKAMEKVHMDFPDDKEAAVFYALSLDASANPADTSFANQKKAANILFGLYPGEPNHPGIVHYIIHSYDYPELAALALPAARKYASIAPSSAHAQHMPSHIFTRLGLWDEDIQSNLVAKASAKCYAENTGIKAHWDEELHALDYLVYSYLQKGDNNLAKKEWSYLDSIDAVSPINFKVAYAYAAIPSRCLLENKDWKAAAILETHPPNLSWEKYPWQKAIIHFTRLLGAANTGHTDAARTELKNLHTVYDTLMNQKDPYKARQVEIQMKTGEAWILFKEGKNNEALSLMNTAADIEDKTEKHPVTPGEVLPARELLGDMLMEMNKPTEALEAYKADLKRHPNRFNGLYGAGIAAEKTGNVALAKSYYQQLAEIATTSQRSELEKAHSFLKTNKAIPLAQR